MFTFFWQAKRDASEVIKQTEENKKLSAKKEIEVQEAKAALDSLLGVIGNLVHDSVPISDDEVGNPQFDLELYLFVK